MYTDKQRIRSNDERGKGCRAVTHELLARVISSLPKPSMWLGVIRAREDGSTPEGVFGVIDRIRTQLFVQYGELRHGSQRRGALRPERGAVLFAKQDVITAHQLVIEELDADGLILASLGRGTRSSAVYEDDLHAVRRDLFTHLGDLLAVRETDFRNAKSR